MLKNMLAVLSEFLLSQLFLCSIYGWFMIYYEVEKLGETI